MSLLLRSALSGLIEHLNRPWLLEAMVIPWGSPVPAFGNLSRSKVATLGLNPSNREFIDFAGRELDGPLRRFHTLKSLGLSRWADADPRHVELIADSCREYFFRNPYDRWFKKLDFLISGTQTSYYDAFFSACHLDLVPYATAAKWGKLSVRQRSSLLSIGGDSLGLLLKQSPVRVLILNGSSVVEQFQDAARVHLNKRIMHDWALRRGSDGYVSGYSYQAVIRSLFGVDIDRDVMVLGFNHNVQSSFGVTTQVMSAIKRWISYEAAEVLS